MEHATSFDLNRALQHWLEQLGQSPQVKAENLKELESHVRDSVVQLQTKGLSSEESFLIATRRAGSAAQLEPEFAKVNRNPFNKIAHGVVLAFIAMACRLIWGLLHMFGVICLWQGHAPAYTGLCIGLAPRVLTTLVIVAALYCMWVWLRKADGRHSWVAFLATATAVLAFVTLLAMFAAAIPVMEVLHQDFWRK